MATFKAETKIDPFRLNYAKPRNYNVKIVGGKKVLIWDKEEPKKKREVFVVGADNLKNKSHLVPTALQERKDEKRPPSSDSIKSSYKTLPPIRAKSPTASRDSDLDHFVSGQMRNVGSKVLEDFLATLTKLDVGRERGLPPETIVKVVQSEKYQFGIDPVLPALLERFPHYYYYTGTQSGRVSYELFVAYLQQRAAERHKGEPTTVVENNVGENQKVLEANPNSVLRKNEEKLTLG